MRIVLLALTLLLAGCASDPAEPTDGSDPTSGGTGGAGGAGGAGEAAVQVPDAIHYDGQIFSVAGPMGTVCPMECEETYSFTIEDELFVEVTLISNQEGLTDPTGTSGVETDYDLIVSKGGSEVGSSYEFGNQPDVVAKLLEPGTYSVEVFAYQGTGGTYDLDIVFSAPA